MRGKFKDAVRNAGPGENDDLVARHYPVVKKACRNGLHFCQRFAIAKLFPTWTRPFSQKYGVRRLVCPAVKPIARVADRWFEFKPR